MNELLTWVRNIPPLVGGAFLLIVFLAAVVAATLTGALIHVFAG